MEKVIVSVRIRPLNEKEISHNEKCMWSSNSLEKRITISGSALCDLLENKIIQQNATVSCNFGIF